MTEVDPEDDTEVDDDVEELVAEPADLEEVDDPDAVINVDESDDDDDDVVIDDDDDDEGETVPVAEAATDDDDDEDEDEEGDVEASLDVILKERLVQVDEEDDDDEEAPNDPEDRAAPEAAKVLPKQPKEFVCQSCFLVKHPSQMSDSKRKLCRDCV